MRFQAVLAVAFLTASFNAADVCAAEKSDKLVIHEWGTFTSLQDEQGRAIGGINADEEQLPAFVHTMNLVSPVGEVLSKGVPAAMQSVTMRLETPVLYFYPAASTPKTVDVGVRFNGGLLTQFYPDAAATKPTGRNIEPTTVGELSWKNITLGGTPAIPETDAHVWLAPRDVKAASVTVGKESERYLFYRGLGNLPSPLAVVQSEKGLTVAPVSASAKDMRIEKIWLYEIRPDGRAAFRVLPGVRDNPRADQTFPTTPRFVESDYADDALKSLRKSMHEALVAEGLFADEATAMLKTWELSYFKSPGLRVFFIVPRDWTDAVLPLTVSTDAEITRVMVGRVDVVTPWQRDILAKMKTAAPEAQASLRQSLGRFGTAIANDANRRESELIKLTHD